MFATRFICASALLMFALTNTFYTVAGQRSPYAGSRPGGLNQRDKYHISSSNNASTDFASRFGAPENNVPFGTAQRPPVGLPVVMPEGAFTPLQPSVVGGLDSNSVSFSNRLGETTANTQNVAVGVPGVPLPQMPFIPQLPQQQPLPQTQPQPQPQPQGLAPLPLDAHGDQELINQLSLLPEDKRPFWFLNYQAIEAQRTSSLGFNSGIVQTQGSFAG